MSDFSSLKFDDRGLIPAVVQNQRDGRVLMLAYMNDEALKRTLEGPDVWFFSRSRQELWHKGETSGSFLRVHSVTADCDGDTVLVSAVPAGPVCHTGDETCFDRAPLGGEPDGAQPAPGPAVLTLLARVIGQRHAEMPDGSYTASLFKEGRPRIAQKVVEEAAEAAIAAVAVDGGDLASEVADMFYHALVLLEDAGVDPSEVWQKLDERRT